MFPQSLPRKLVQISEEVSPVNYVPLTFGNEIFLLAQQDSRKIEDSRRFSLSKLLPNGDIKSFDIPNPLECLQQILNPNNLWLNQNFSQLCEYLKKHQQIPQQQYLAACPQPMEVSPGECGNPIVASIEQQLQWSNCVNTSAPFPMTYSFGTSTTELNTATKQTCCCCCQNCQSSYKNTKLPGFNKSTNTQVLPSEHQVECNKAPKIFNAREQLKQKKLKYAFTYIN